MVDGLPPVSSFHQAEVVPSLVFWTVTSPGAHISGNARCIPDLGLKNTYARNVCHTFELFQF